MIKQCQCRQVNMCDDNTDTSKIYMYIYIYTYVCRSMKQEHMRTHEHTVNSAREREGPHNLPHHPFSKHHGTLAAAMPQPLERLGSPQHDAAAIVGRAVQENQRRHQNTHTGRQARCCSLCVYVYT